ncbi:MAG: hypothetical protein JKY89_04050 [Immundisolibacteraceae bacterium]|nr:hypothetical protein [Immundisolibacteraceae bacterium]
MSGLIIAGLLIAAILAWIVTKPLTALSGQSANSETQVALAQRRQSLEQQIGATQLDRKRGDLDPKFADDEQARLELELLQVLELIDQGSVNDQAEVAGRAPSALQRLALFGLISIVAGGLYYQHQQPWWQAHQDGLIVQATTAIGPMGGGAMGSSASGGLPMLADGTPDIGAMVKRLATRLEQSPDDGAGWKRLGRSYFVLERYAESTSAYAKAAAILSDDFTLIQGYAMSRMATISAVGSDIAVADSIEQMVASLHQQVMANPEDIDGYRAMASVYIMVSRRDLAGDMYEQVLARQPKDVSIAVMAASNRFIVDKGELTAQVGAAYERVAALDPADQSVIWYRGYVAYQNKQWQQVLNYWQPLLEGLPTDANDSRRIREAVEEARQQLARTS